MNLTLVNAKKKKKKENSEKLFLLQVIASENIAINCLY